MITLVCSEGLAGMMVRSDFNRPFDRWLIGLTTNRNNKKFEDYT